jgi:hypothetical protein
MCQWVDFRSCMVQPSLAVTQYIHTGLLLGMCVVPENL